MEKDISVGAGNYLRDTFQGVIHEDVLKHLEEWLGGQIEKERQGMWTDFKDVL